MEQRRTVEDAFGLALETSEDMLLPDCVIEILESLVQNLGIWGHKEQISFIGIALAEVRNERGYLQDEYRKESPDVPLFRNTCSPGNSHRPFVRGVSIAQYRVDFQNCRIGHYRFCAACSSQAGRQRRVCLANHTDRGDFGFVNGHGACG